LTPSKKSERFNPHKPLFPLQMDAILRLFGYQGGFILVITMANGSILLIFNSISDPFLLLQIISADLI